MKNILITGASGNLGRIIVSAFEQSGDYHINIISREEVHESKNLKAFHIDLLDEIAAASLVKQIIETQEHLDAVIFLTGGYINGDITLTSSADIQKMISLNLAMAHNIAGPLISINRYQKRKLKLVFVGAKAAMDISEAVNNIAYALSKKALYHYASLINESENKSVTSAFILLPGTLDTSYNRQVMPDADFSTWTQATDISLCIKEIIEDIKSDRVIEF